MYYDLEQVLFLGEKNDRSHCAAFFKDTKKRVA